MVSLSRVALLAMMAVLVGCASTKQARSMEQTGFLGELAPLMQKGKEGEARASRVQEPAHRADPSRNVQEDAVGTGDLVGTTGC